jgi:hypothetical protein
MDFEELENEDDIKDDDNTLEKEDPTDEEITEMEKLLHID